MDNGITERLGRLVGALDHGGYLIAAIATAHCAATGALLGFEVSGALLLLAASGTFLVYFLDRVVHIPDEDRINRPHRVAWIDRHGRYQVAVALVAGIVAVVAASRLDLSVLAFAAVLGLVGAMHRMPLGDEHRLKDYPLLKPALLGIVWALGAAVLPVVEAGLHPLEWSMVLLPIGRFGLVAANVLLCDLYDREGDGFELDWSDTSVRRIASAVAIGSAAIMAGGAMVAPLGGLWMFDAAGSVLLAGAALAGESVPSVRRPVVLDTIVAWPALTVLLAVV